MTAAPQLFNSDYYVAVATVIPLFLLALSFGTFKGLGVGYLMDWSKRSTKKVARVTAITALNVIVLVVFGALASELKVFLALKGHYNLTPIWDFIVLVSLIGAGICGTMGTFVSAFSQIADES
jgi:hypothetical protein